MDFSEKIRTLRKKNGLSQEQLAECLGVSRQTVSKWELGQAMPDYEKLVAIGAYFQLSLDELVKSELVPAPLPQESQGPEPKQQTVGRVFCAIGLLGLALWGGLMFCSPEGTEQLSASSMITIDGTGLLVVGCVAALVLGVALILKGSPRK